MQQCEVTYLLGLPHGRLIHPGGERLGPYVVGAEHQGNTGHTMDDAPEMS